MSYEITSVREYSDGLVEFDAISCGSWETYECENFVDFMDTLRSLWNATASQVDKWWRERTIVSYAEEEAKQFVEPCIVEDTDDEPSEPLDALVKAHPEEFKRLAYLISKHNDHDFGTFNNFEFKNYGDKRHRKMEKELSEMCDLFELFGFDPSPWHPWESSLAEEDADAKYMLLFIDDYDRLAELIDMMEA